ncbi:hypothetical protein [Eubacterium ramulus]|uniref:Uncharacterized protein n=1 Tax=Eubacterium ramulus TaxID=39490 RepID=A0A173VIT9_EUBRA|nr:hypothetical protein [Eubacterium ramulus]CUN26994.1 Uncharacterised protein [Eubacterium ramulus]
MSESEKEKKIFLSYCGSRDQELLTGRKKMTLGDMERFSFLTEFFGLESYGLNLWKEFGDDVEEPLDALIKSFTAVLMWYQHAYQVTNYVLHKRIFKKSAS